MFILYRYILRGLIGPFIFGVLVLIFLFLTNYFIKNISDFLSRDVPVMVILELIGLNIAWILALVIPMGVLLAVLMAFGRFSADNEITALKANGIGVHQVMLPVLLIAIMMAVGMFFFNDRVLPEVNLKQKSLLIHVHKKKPALAFKEGVFSDNTLIRQYSILLDKIDENSSWVYGVTIFDQSNPLKQTTITAEKATIEFIEEYSEIKFVLYNGEMHEVDSRDLGEYKRSTFDKNITLIEFVSDQFTRDGQASRGDRELSIEMMYERIGEKDNSIGQFQRFIGDRVKQYLKVDLDDYPDVKQFLINLRSDDFIKNERNTATKIKNPYGYELVDKINENTSAVFAVSRLVSSIEIQIQGQKKLFVEMHKKYSIPVACIVFVLVGIPLGVRSRHGGLAVGGSLGVLFFLIYWAFLIGGETLADRNLIDPWLSMWAANIFVGAIGIWLTVKMMQEKGIVDSKLYNIFAKIGTKKG